jgi:DNA polymerase
VKSISIDIETYSSADLTRRGVYRYAEADDFAVVLFGYSADGGDVKVVDLANGEKIPAEVLSALTDDGVAKWAYNSQFERVCLSRHLGLPLGTYLSPQSWRCSMVWAAVMGLPMSLAEAGAVLGLEKQKLTEGKDLIRRFCTPPRRVPQMSIFGDDALWERFKEYCKRDVESEMAIKDRLSRFPVPDGVWGEFVRDQEMNDRGVLIDVDLAKQAVETDAAISEKLLAEMRLLTGLDNPSSVVQLKDWLANNGVDIESLGKSDVAAVKGETKDGKIVRVLELRELTAKSSIKK